METIVPANACACYVRSETRYMERNDRDLKPNGIRQDEQRTYRPQNMRGNPKLCSSILPPYRAISIDAKPPFLKRHTGYQRHEKDRPRSGGKHRNAL